MIKRKLRGTEADKFWKESAFVSKYQKLTSINTVVESHLYASHNASKHINT